MTPPDDVSGFSRHGRRSLVLGAAAALVTSIAIVLLVVGVLRSGRNTTPNGDGVVNVVKRTAPDFDRYTTNPTPSFRSWMNARLWRAVVYSPYFDDKTTWYQRGWVYRDLYGIPTDSSIVRAHPDWILRDANGQPLYLQWGCSEGTCPQYAADPGNATFRRSWIDETRRELARGRYRGVWIDDVNLDLRVSDGNGKLVYPVKDGTTMTEDEWRAAIAGFTATVRQAFPQIELIHNAIWYAGGSPRTGDPSIRREIRSADWINLERGANDDGLVGGDGPFSFAAFLGYIDAVHALGRSVILESYDGSSIGREYNLAAYFLVSGGHDGLGDNTITPATDWNAYRFDLGAANGPRDRWHGLYRRSFARGLVLLNPPDGHIVRADLGGRYLTTDGRTVTRIRLAPRQAAVLRPA